MIQQRGPHGPVRDEQLKHEVRGLLQGGHTTRAEEWRDPEPAGEDQPTGDTGILPEDRRGTPAGMRSSDVEARFEVARFLGPSAFPSDREGLAGVARRNNAPDRILGWLEELRPGVEYRNIQDVAREVGIGTETPRPGTPRPGRDADTDVEGADADTEGTDTEGTDTEGTDTEDEDAERPG